MKKLKHIIREQIKLLKEQDNTFTVQNFQYCNNAPVTLAFNFVWGEGAPVENQTQLQQQFYEAMGSPSVGGITYFWGSGCLEYLGATDLTSDTDLFDINGYMDEVGPIYGIVGEPDFLTYAEPFLFDNCEQCQGSCASRIANYGTSDMPFTMFDFCSKCNEYGGVYDDTTIDLYSDCCDICDDSSYQKYKCETSATPAATSYGGTCVATWESDAPFNTLEECQTSGCGQMDLIGQEPCSGGFSCQDFLDFDGPLPNFQQTICTYFCNPWGSAVSPGLANFLLPYIPCLENWETPTGPDFADYNIAADNSGYEYTGTFSQGYYNPGGLCDMGCCDGEGLIDPYGEWNIGDNDYCNDDVGGGWDYQAFYSWPQDEQDITCAMCNNGGSIEVEFLGSPVTLQLPYNLGPLYCPCCPETGGMPGPDGMALLSKKLNKNSINKLQNKLKKYSQQLSKEDPQKTRMQELANIKNKK